MTPPPGPRAVRDHRDLALEHLALDEVEWKERVCSLEADVQIRDELLSVAVERLRQLTLTLERTQDSLRRLLEVEREAHVQVEVPDA